MRLKIAKLACKILSGNAKFCEEIGLFGTLGIPENDPAYQIDKKNEFDLWLEAQGIDPVVFWKKFDAFLQSSECKEQYNFIYISGLPPWEQSWNN